MNKAVFGILGVLVLGGLAFAGRNMFQGSTNRGSERLAEEVINDATGGQVDLSTNNGTIQVSNEDGSASAAYGSNVALPANFPSNVPTPQTGNLISAYGGTDTGQASFALVYTVTGTDVLGTSQSYQDRLRAAGFTVQDSGSASGSGGTVSGFTATNGQTTINVAVTATGTTTNLSVTVTQQ